MGRIRWQGDADCVDARWVSRPRDVVSLGPVVALGSLTADPDPSGSHPPTYYLPPASLSSDVQLSTETKHSFCEASS